jgi:hypothetical protein
MSFLLFASQFNNQGVYHLQQNRFAIANELFQAALTSLCRHSMVGVSPLSHAPIYQPLAQPSRFPIPTHDIQTDTTTHTDHGVVSPLQLAGSTETRECVDAQYFLYTQGMILDPNNAQGSLKSTTKMFICAILFNLALVHHKEGLLLGSNSHLHIALRLYCDCAHILEHTHKHASFASYCHLQTLLYNNMAHIHFGWHDYATFHLCLQRVALVTSHGKHTLNHMAHFPMMPIVLNLFLLSSHPVASAA